IARRAVWITLHHHRPILKMRQQQSRNVGVVLNQISLADFQLRPKQLLKISEFDSPTRESDLELLDVLRYLDATLSRLRATRACVFRRMIIAMGFGSSHIRHRFT